MNFLHLCINNNVANVPYARSCNQIFSTIDHCIVSDNLTNNILRYESIFMHNNFSDHLPLYLELKLELSYVKLPKETISSKTIWDKCSEDCIKITLRMNYSILTLTIMPSLAEM